METCEEAAAVIQGLDARGGRKDWRAFVEEKWSQLGNLVHTMQHFSLGYCDMKLVALTETEEEELVWSRREILNMSSLRCYWGIEMEMTTDSWKYKSESQETSTFGRTIWLYPFPPNVLTPAICNSSSLSSLSPLLKNHLLRPFHVTFEMTSLTLTIPIAHLLSSSSLHIPEILLIICSLHSHPLRDGMPVSSSCLRNYTLKGIYVSIRLPRWHSGNSEESACQWRRCKLDPWVRKIPWSRKWQPTPSCLGNPMDRGVWRATVHGVEKI